MGRRPALILVVDDEAPIQLAMKNLLEGWGFRTVIAGSCDELLEKLAHCPDRPDLIICDWRMHPVDGLAVLRKLRLQPSQDFPRIPFIMLTGHNSNEDVTTAIGEGADSYIVKPFSSATLMSHLLKVIIDDKGHLDARESWAV